MSIGARPSLSPSVEQRERERMEEEGKREKRRKRFCNYACIKCIMHNKILRTKLNVSSKAIILIEG
jgi:hypothetical protein